MGRQPVAFALSIRTTEARRSALKEAVKIVDRLEDLCTGPAMATDQGVLLPGKVRRNHHSYAIRVIARSRDRGEPSGLAQDHDSYERVDDDRAEARSFIVPSDAARSLSARRSFLVHPFGIRDPSSGGTSCISSPCAISRSKAPSAAPALGAVGSGRSTIFHRDQVQGRWSRSMRIRSPRARPDLAERLRMSIADSSRSRS
jgi:hypothetical protein